MFTRDALTASVGLRSRRSLLRIVIARPRRGNRPNEIAADSGNDSVVATAVAEDAPRKFTHDVSSGFVRCPDWELDDLFSVLAGDRKNPAPAVILQLLQRADS